MRSTTENAIYIARDEIYLVFAKKIYSTEIQSAQPIYFFPGRFSFALTFSLCLLGIHVTSGGNVVLMWKRSLHLENGLESYLNEISI